MAFTMPVDLKVKWIDALLSGEFAQGTGRLRRGDSFCCLGVLCEIDERITRHDAPKVMRTDREQYEVEYCCENCDGEYDAPEDGPAIEREAVDPEGHEYDYSLDSDPDQLLANALPSEAMVKLWSNGTIVKPYGVWECRISEETEFNLFTDVLRYTSYQRDYDSYERYIDADLASLNDAGAPFDLIARVIEAKF